MPAPEPSPRPSWSLSPKTAPAPELQPDLFSSASKSEDGYSRWRAEAEAERAALEAARAAAELPESGSTAGYDAWKADTLARRADFEKRWGLRLGCRVRLQLRGEPRERVGLIQLVDDLSDQTLQGTRKPLRLRIGDHLFLPVQIESLVTCED